MFRLGCLQPGGRARGKPLRGPAAAAAGPPSGSSPAWPSCKAAVNPVRSVIVVAAAVSLAPVASLAASRPESSTGATVVAAAARELSQMPRWNTRRRRRPSSPPVLFPRIRQARDRARHLRRSCPFRLTTRRIWLPSKRPQGPRIVTPPAKWCIQLIVRQAELSNASSGLRLADRAATKRQPDQDAGLDA